MLVDSCDDTETDQDEYYPEDPFEPSSFIGDPTKPCDDRATSDSYDREHERESECVDERISHSCDQ